MPIGSFKTRVVILRRSASTEVRFGDREESYDPAGEAWAEIDEVGGSKRRGFQQVETRADALVILRGWPDVSAADRLRVKATGLVYRLESIRLGSNETICDAYRLTEGER